MEFADCATATVDAETASPAEPTRIPPRTNRERVSPRTTRTQSPMRNAPFIVLAAVTANGPTDSQGPSSELFTAFCKHCKRNRRPNFPFPLIKLPQGNDYEVARCRMSLK